MTYADASTIPTCYSSTEHTRLFTRCWIAQRRLPGRGLHRFSISAGGGEADAAVAALCTHDHANEHPAAPRGSVSRSSTIGVGTACPSDQAPSELDGCRDRR